MAEPLTYAVLIAFGCVIVLVTALAQSVRVRTTREQNRAMRDHVRRIY